MNLLPKIFPQTDEQRKLKLERSLIGMEAKIGGTLFGAVPKGHRRQFFCLDRHTWVWHEEWRDAAGHNQAVTTKYLVRPSGIFKSQNDQPPQHLSDNEARNFYQSTQLYGQRMNAEYDRLIQAAYGR